MRGIGTPTCSWLPHLLDRQDSGLRLNRLEKILARPGKLHWMMMGKNGFENVLVRHALKVEPLIQDSSSRAVGSPGDASPYHFGD